MDHQRITTKTELQALARKLKVRPDWHEPDEREVDADVHGSHLGNAGFWGMANIGQRSYEEFWVEIIQGEAPVAEVNLADLLAFACQDIIDRDGLAKAIMRVDIYARPGLPASALAGLIIEELANQA